MSKARFFLAGLLVLACAGAASANSLTDPGVIFQPGTGSTCITITPLGNPFCSPPRVGLNFPIPVTAGVPSVFKNNTGMIIYSLTLLLSAGPRPAQGRTLVGSSNSEPGLSLTTS